MNNHTIYVELDGLEFEIEFEYSYHYDPGVLSGPWEDSYPEEESFDYNVLTTDEGLNAIESWEFMEIGGEVFYQAAMENEASDRADYIDYRYDNWHEYEIDNAEGS